VRLLGKTSGYTDNPARAMPNEPEAVDRETQRRITLDAARNWPRLHTLQTEERREAPLHHRLQRVKSQARLAGIDVYQELRLTRLAIENGRPAAHVERRVQALEARVFRR
jgi:hypothetical protein